MNNEDGTLLEKVARRGNLRRAWELLNKQNPSSSGVDEVKIADFASCLDGNLASIQARLLSGAYAFSAARGVLVPKKSGTGKRPLRIPTVSDRVVQKAILIQLEKLPSFRKFRRNPSSFAYIRRRKLKDLVTRTQKLIQTHKWVLECDIANFFDTVQQDRMLKEIAALLPDQSLIPLIQDALRAEVHDLARMPIQKAAYFPRPGQGLPQGAALSPLLSNVYLHTLDTTLVRQKFPPVRFADDFIVFAKSQERANEAFALSKAILTDLGLRVRELNEATKPSRIIPSSGGFDFVGLRFENKSVRPTQKAIDHLYERIRGIMAPDSSESLIERYLQCEHVMSGWRAAYAAVTNVQSYMDNAASTAAEGVHALLRSRGLAHGRGPSRSQRKFLRVLPRLKQRKNDQPGRLKENRPGLTSIGKIKAS